MLHAGEDIRFIARRLIICASEDVGMADSNALMVATSAQQAVEFVGLPEAQLILAHATVYIATAPKSNRCTMAIAKATSEVREGRTLAVPPHLRDTHYRGTKRLGHGEGYRVASHDYPGGYVPQAYLPEGRISYEPTENGLEKRVKERLEHWRSLFEAERGRSGSGRRFAASAIAGLAAGAGTTSKKLIGIQLFQFRRHKFPILPDDLAVEPNFATSVIRPLNTYHVPMDPALVAVTRRLVSLSGRKMERTGDFLVEEDVPDRIQDVGVEGYREFPDIAAPSSLSRISLSFLVSFAVAATMRPFSKCRANIVERCALINCGAR